MDRAYNNHNYGDLLSANGLNTLTFRDPYAKLCFTTALASHFDKVIYVDLDTTFTSYFKAGLLADLKSVDIYLPEEGRFANMLKDVLEHIGNSSLVIFDSVNSFYSMYYGKVASARDNPKGRVAGSLNHLLSIFIMFLVKHGISASVPVLVTSMIRYRKDKGWVQSPASRRFLQTKSAVKLSVERIDKDLAVSVLQHPILPAGTVAVYKDRLITASHSQA